MAVSPVRRRPQTLKQAKKAYQKNGGVKKLSEREIRQLERAAELQERAARINEREARRKLNLQKKEERLEKERQARAKAGLKEEPIGRLGKIGASQCRLGSQWFSRHTGPATIEERKCSAEEVDEDIEEQLNIYDEHEQSGEWSQPMSAQKRRRFKRITIEQGHVSTAVSPNQCTSMRTPLEAVDGNARTVSKANGKSTTLSRSYGAFPQKGVNTPLPNTTSPTKQCMNHGQSPKSAGSSLNVRSPTPRATKPTASILRSSADIYASHDQSAENSHVVDPIDKRKAIHPPPKSATVNSPARNFSDDWDLAFPSNTQVAREILSPIKRPNEMPRLPRYSLPKIRARPALSETPTDGKGSLHALISSKTPQKSIVKSPPDKCLPCTTGLNRFLQSTRGNFDFLFDISTQDIEDDLMEEERLARIPATREIQHKICDRISSPTSVKNGFDDDHGMTLHDESLLEAFVTSLSEDDESKAKPQEGIAVEAGAPKHVGSRALITNGAGKEADQGQACVANDSFSSDYFDFGSQEIIDLEGLMAGT